MKKIEVKVSENASIAEIAGKIAKGLAKQKAIEGKRSTQKLIGSGRDEVEVIESGIQINVTRNLRKHDETVNCFCGTAYMKSTGIAYKTNYGGITRKRSVCSIECFDAVKEVCGGRVARIGQKLTPVRTY